MCIYIYIYMPAPTTAASTVDVKAGMFTLHTGMKS